MGGTGTGCNVGGGCGCDGQVAMRKERRPRVGGYGGGVTESGKKYGARDDGDAADDDCCSVYTIMTYCLLLSATILSGKCGLGSATTAAAMEPNRLGGTSIL